MQAPEWGDRPHSRAERVGVRHRDELDEVRSVVQQVHVLRVNPQVPALDQHPDRAERVQRPGSIER